LARLNGQPSDGLGGPFVALQAAEQASTRYITLIQGCQDPF